MTVKTLVPTLRVGTHVGTLRVESAFEGGERIAAAEENGTQSVPACVPHAEHGNEVGEAC
jgi:hypothetical protein